ncbi:MAG: excinuclease ABC subunit UvrA [Acidobacteriia bacterium]|nr:excinuclease ABC subunit UvrA [Terriglobia bacterium]
MESNSNLIVRGARVNNLKNISFELPFNRLTVVTGVSGSGKSSLAFDLLYAEGQRRYIESLSAYARQFLERIEKPDVDSIDGIMPAIAIRQKTSSRNPRSTVATTTEVYDFLRLLFARIGETYCHRCGEQIQKDSPEQIAERILKLPEGTRFYVLFPVSAAATTAPPSDPKAVRVRKPKSGPVAPSPAAKEILGGIRKGGFGRLVQGGRVFEFSTPESLIDLNLNAPVYVLVDRLSVNPDVRQRLIDSLETCFKEGKGQAIIQVLDDRGSNSISPPELSPEVSAGTSEAGKEESLLFFSDQFECKRCRIPYPQPEPQLFSFNNPYGACPRCQGFGNTIDFDLDLVIPDKNKSLEDGAIEPWTKLQYRHPLVELRKLAREESIPLNIPYSQLSEGHKKIILEGKGRFPGLKGFFQYLERKKYKLHVRVFLSRYRGYSLCPDCQGTRLRVEARDVKVGGKAVTEINAMTIAEAHAFFERLSLTPSQEAIASKLLEEIRLRLKFLYEVGLHYISLDRLASTLSGGESQRIQLASSLGSSLVGTLYILDEPSIGLHPRDSQKLIGLLKNLREMGNTVVVVEHDAEMMKAADYILDLGPGAGEMGGTVVFSGPFDRLTQDSHSLTGRYLSGDLRINVPRQRARQTGKYLKVFGAQIHNLKNIDLSIPLGLMVTITGVSGSGKSTLVHNVIYDAYREHRGEKVGHRAYSRIEGWQHIKEVILVDQSPIGRSPRSNPVTYIKAFDAIRDVFASTPEAQKHGMHAGHFSFNIPGGRCVTCEGDGRVTVEMQFLADVELICEDCKGCRFKPSVLEVRYRGKNIHDVLQMTVREALSFFSNFPKIVKKLKVLDEVGLGYIRLGQSATTLSGGEAQRVKLATHLAQATSDSVLYIFDEPTTGLHFDDINKLLHAFHKLIEAKASLLIIEHNLDVIKSSDWVIDLGPEGGDAGGQVVAYGTPEQVARIDKSYTGKYLKGVLSNNGNHDNGGGIRTLISKK